MNVYQHPYSYYLVLLTLFMLSACSQDMSDLEDFVNEIKINASSTIEPIPARHAVPPFSYPKHNKDPFDGSALQPKMSPKGVQGVQINPDHRLQFLENFSLESMQMVGIIHHSNRVWGVIKSSDGKIHRVKIGDYIGTNHGKITAISPTKIDIVELIPNETGAYSPRNNVIHLEQNQHHGVIESSKQPATLKEQSVD